MQVLISAAGGSDWSYGGAILTFVFPMLLFIFVAGGLYVAYTLPHLDPGRRQTVERPGLTTTLAVRTAALRGGAGQAGAASPRPAADAGGGAESAGEPTAAGPGDE